jgi:hypothetical protein
VSVIENTSWATQIAPAQTLFTAETPLSASSYSIHGPKNLLTCFLDEPTVYSPTATRGSPSFAADPSAIPVAPHWCYTHFRVFEELTVDRVSSSVDRSYSESAVHVIGSSFRLLAAFDTAINTAFGVAILVIWSQFVIVASCYAIRLRSQHCVLRGLSLEKVAFFSGCNFEFCRASEIFGALVIIGMADSTIDSRSFFGNGAVTEGERWARIYSFSYHISIREEAPARKPSSGVAQSASCHSTRSSLQGTTFQVASEYCCFMGNTVAHGAKSFDVFLSAEMRANSYGDRFLNLQAVAIGGEATFRTSSPTAPSCSRTANARSTPILCLALRHLSLGRFPQTHIQRSWVEKSGRTSNLT